MRHRSPRRSKNRLLIRRSVVVIGLLIELQNPAAAASEYGELETRLNREAGLLFATIIKDRGKPFGHCELSSDWDSYPVSMISARKHLRLSVHGNIAKPDFVAALPEVIGPLLPWTDPLCDKDALKKREDALVAKRQEAIRAGGDLSTMARLAQSQTTYTFPVFDRTLTRAIVNVSITEYLLVVAADGTRKKQPPHGAGEERIYAKRNGAWRLIDRQSLFHFH